MMFQSVCLALTLVTFVTSAPVEREILDELLLISEDPTLNVIDIDGTDFQQVDIDAAVVDPLPNNKQIFPDRVRLVTGHRIPLGQFPEETQRRILELTDKPTGGVESAVTDADADKYVQASSFRQSAVSASTQQPRLLPNIREDLLPGVLTNRGEVDNTYHRTLDIFAPPSFF